MHAGAPANMRLPGATVPCGRHATTVLQSSLPAELSWLEGVSFTHHAASTLYCDVLT